MSLLLTSPAVLTLRERNASPTVLSGNRELLDRLAPPGTTVDELIDTYVTSGSAYEVAKFLTRLHSMMQNGVIRLTLRMNGQDLLAIEAVADGYQGRLPENVAASRWRLDTFAHARAVAGQLILEAPESQARVIFLAPLIGAALPTLAQPASVEQIVDVLPNLNTAEVAMVVAWLASADMIQRVDYATDSDVQTWSLWEFHDLLLHTRSRWGRYDAPTGATYPFIGKVSPQPAIVDRASDRRISLYQPDLIKVANADPPFTTVLERRRSIREHGEGPIRIDQLGEFLFRCARIRAVYSPETNAPYERTSRPYPSGGAAYELEIYPVVGCCAGLETGIYHYDPAEHQLDAVCLDTVAVGQLLNEARLAYAGQATPQVLLAITARFERVSWKYRGIAYAVVLKNLGALYQTMYLVATAMDLAPCALGSGSTHTLVDVVGLDYLTESAVGEFILGSCRDH